MYINSFDVNPEFNLPNQKPIGQVVPNVHHPLYHNLQHFFVFNEDGGTTVRDVVGGYAAENTTTAPDPIKEVDSLEGRILTTDSTLHNGLAYSSNHVWMGSTYTLVARINVNSTLDAPHVWAGVAWDDGGQMLRFVSTTEMHHAADGNYAAFSMSDFVLGEWQTHIFRRDGVHAEYWIDGKQQGAQGWDYSSSSSLGLRYLTGAVNDRLDGSVSHLIGWSGRYLNDTEMDSVVRDPYQLLIPKTAESFILQTEAVGSQTVDVLLSTETNSAFIITPIKSTNIDQSVETNSASNITPIKSTNIDQSIETGISFNIPPSGKVLNALIHETDSAFAISTLRNVLIDQAGETNSTFSILPVKSIPTIQSVETNSAFSITIATIQFVDSPVLDAETNNVLTTTGFGSDINSLTIETGVGVNQINVSGTLSGTAGSYTFDMPDVSSYSFDTQGTPFNSASWTHTITAGDGTASATEVIIVNPKAGWAVVEITNAVQTVGSVFENFIGLPPNTTQVYYPTNNNTAVSPTGILTTDQLTGTISMQFFDIADSTWKPFAINLSVLSLIQETDTSFGITAFKSIPLVHSLETDLVFDILTSNTQAIGLSSEIDSTFGITAFKSIPLVHSLETDFASLIIEAGSSVLVLGNASENNLAFGVTWNRFVSIHQSLETETVANVTGVYFKDISQAQEICTIFAVEPNISHSIGQIIELDHAFELFAYTIGSVALAYEVDIVNDVSVLSRVSLIRTNEVDDANHITISAVQFVELVIENSDAFIINPTWVVTVEPSIESNIGFVVYAALSVLQKDFNLEYVFNNMVEVSQTVDINNHSTLSIDNNIINTWDGILTFDNDIPYNWQGNLLWAVRNLEYEYGKTINTSLDVINIENSGGVWADRLMLIERPAILNVDQMLGFIKLDARAHFLKIGKRKTIRFVDK